jgi:hypothetical protein
MALAINKNVIKNCVCLFFAMLHLLPNSVLAQVDSLATYLPESCYHSGQYQQQKNLRGLENPLLSQGSFVFNCNQGLIWHTQSPIVETIVYKTKGKHFILHEGASAQVLSSKIHQSLGKTLNNLIGGNSAYLQQTFTFIQNQQGLVLTPKKQHMKNFLKSLNIEKKSDGVTITLLLAENETTIIRIFDRQNFAVLEEKDCAQIKNSLSPACKLLFKGL